MASSFLLGARLAVKESNNRLALALTRRSLLPACSYHACSRLLQSTLPKEKISMPPNFTIDPRSTCSPFYGLEQIVVKAVENKEEGDDANETAKEEKVQELNLDTDSDEIWYDASTKKDDVVYAVPLPERLHVPVFDVNDGAETGTLWLNDQVFGMDPIRVDLLQRAVLYIRNKMRGRRKAITKTISEVSGSGRKVRPQKGQGAARAGHSRPAHWRGGAKAHGPKGWIQNYGNTKLNKKVKRQALLHALSQKLKEGNLILVNDLFLESHKTKDLANVLENFNIAGRHGTTAYILDHVEEDNENNVVVADNVPVHLMASSKNLFKIKVVNQRLTNVYDILKHEKLFMTLGAVTAMEERLTAPKEP